VTDPPPGAAAAGGAQWPDDYAPRHDVPVGGRSGFSLIDGRQVHYLEWGAVRAPNVLCLHGGGQTAYMYEELGAALAPRFHVVAPDLPNHGDSDPVDLDDTGSRHALAGTLPALYEHFGIAPAVVVGASLGGITAITLGAARPDLVGGIVLIDIGHRLEEEGVKRIIEFMRAHESFASLDEAAVEISRYLPHRREVRPESLSRNLRQRPDGRWIWKHGMARRWREEGATDEMPDWRNILEGLAEDAASLQCPVLVLRGGKSDVLSDQGAAEIAELIPDSRLRTVANAGHLAAGDNPESTVGLVNAFLDEIAW
jgi:pimeloyl-ACP methyl ester carboxylesterase